MIVELPMVLKFESNHFVFVFASTSLGGVSPEGLDPLGLVTDAKDISIGELESNKLKLATCRRD